MPWVFRRRTDELVTRIKARFDEFLNTQTRRDGSRERRPTRVGTLARRAVSPLGFRYSARPRNSPQSTRTSGLTVTDFEREFPSVCFALATGVGKTRLMGAFVTYLHLYGLVSRMRSSLTKPRDAGEDIVGGLGPAEGPWGLVGDGQVLPNRGFEGPDTPIGPALDLFLRQQREPALHEVELIEESNAVLRVGGASGVRDSTGGKQGNRAW